MRFIVFYNHHPKIQRKQVRAWDKATDFPNHRGEMTHPDFVRYCRLDFKDVSMMGDVIYDAMLKSWCFDSKRPVVFLGTDKQQKNQEKEMVLAYINDVYGQDMKAIQQSLKEQQQIKNHQILSQLKASRIG